jgi:hypothetical protein
MYKLLTGLPIDWYSYGPLEPISQPIRVVVPFTKKSYMADKKIVDPTLVSAER